jgi:hypothetical protein
MFMRRNIQRKVVLFENQEKLLGLYSHMEAKLPHSLAVN